MTQREASACAGVSRVGGGTRVTCANRISQSRIADHAGPAAITDSLELTVPAIGREPHFNFDVGIRCRFDGYGDTAEIRKILVWIDPSGCFLRARRCELAGRDDLRHGYSRVLQFERHKAVTR